MKYAHTNLIAKDWRNLSAFYQRVFNCTPIGTQRDLSGEWLDQLTGIKGAHIEGQHLLLPGYSEEAPTLEIFSYPDYVEMQKQINCTGFSHIAFEVQDVRSVVEALMAEGGTLLGDIVEKEYADMGTATFAYARDPEENLIEIQSWKR